MAHRGEGSTGTDLVPAEGSDFIIMQRDSWFKDGMAKGFEVSEGQMILNPNLLLESGPASI
jgi:hypothetical protein